MGPPDPTRADAKELFLQALELDEESRVALLARLEHEDPKLAREVRGLLGAHGGEAARALERMPETLAARAGRAPPPDRLGDYELLEEIGSGAFGSVWRARQTSLGRIVALKVLRGGPFASARELERLRAEAEAVARLDHPHIVPVHEVGTHEGQAYFSMRWIEGGTLARELGRPWPTRRAAQLAIQLARAVHHAHQRGLLHRDLKPSNVLLDAGGEPYVADFGIAKRLDGEARAASTRTLAGTPPYMAPEQIEGGELTVATDVWALGCLLYELLAGRPAFEGETLTRLLQCIRQEDPPLLRALRSDVPRDLETIVLVCLRKEPSRRYPSADALADDLERWLQHEPIAARRTSLPERIGLFARRSPLAASLIGVAAGLVVLLAVVATWANVQLGRRLRESYLGQARATRLAGTVGSRAAALELLEQAARIEPGADLRDEAIACLALTDLELEHSVERPPGVDGSVWVDPGFELLADVEAGTLVLRSFTDGSVRERLGPSEPVRLAFWSADGRLLFTKHHDSGDQLRDAVFCVWDVARGTELVRRVEAVSGHASCFSPDGRFLAYGTMAGELVLLELETSREVWRLELDERARVLAFAPDGTRMALLGGDEGWIQVRAADSHELLSPRELGAIPYDAVWTIHGLAVACSDRTIRVLSGDALDSLVLCEGHAAEVVDVDASSSLPLLLSYSWDETTGLWEAATGREIRSESARALGFDAEGRRVAMVDSQRWGAWRIAYGEFLNTVRAHEGKAPRDLSFAPDGRVATSGEDGMFLWDGRVGSIPSRRSEEQARAVCVLPGGNAVMLSGNEGLFELALDGGGEPRHLLPGPLESMDLSADGHTLAVQGMREIHLLDPEHPETVRSLPGRPNMEYLTVSDDGARLAAGNWHGEGVLVWDPARGPEPRQLFPGQENIAAALSPDGRLLATATSERFALWDLEASEDAAPLGTVERLRNIGNSPAPVAFSPDGSRVAFGLSNEVVRVLETRTLATWGTLEAPEPAALFELDFSPDGRVLGAACATNRVQLWNLDAIAVELEKRGLDRR